MKETVFCQETGIVQVIASGSRVNPVVKSILNSGFVQKKPPTPLDIKLSFNNTTIGIDSTFRTPYFV